MRHLATVESPHLAIRHPYPAWGLPGCPLLPEVLRAAWHEVRIPHAIRSHLANQNLWTVGDLGAEALLPGETAHPRVQEFLSDMLDGMTLEMRRTQALFREAWMTLDVIGLRCSVRTQNALRNALYRGALSRQIVPSFQQLLDVHQLGLRGVLDFLCSVEVGVPGRSTEELAPVVPEPALIDLANLPWIPNVSGADPRFADLFPGELQHSVEHFLRWGSEDRAQDAAIHRAIIAAVPEIEDRLANITISSLDQQLFDLLLQAAKGNAQHARLIGQHMQCDGRTSKRTLESIGEELGVSRERVRQIRANMMVRCAKGRIYLPAFDRALKVLAERLPMPTSDVALVLQEEGLTTAHWSAEALLALCEHFHRTPPFAIVTTRGLQLLVEAGSPEAPGAWLTTFDRLLAKVGVARLDSLWEAIDAELKEGVTFEQLCELVESLPEYEIHDGTWCWRTDVMAGCHTRPVLKMLSVAGELSLEDLYNGCERNFRFHVSKYRESQLDEMVPFGVFCAYLRQRDELIITEEGSIRMRVPVEPGEILEGTDQQLVSILMQSTDRELSRDDFLALWEARGANRSTLMTMFCYSPLLKSVRRGYWSLRGDSDLPEILGGWARARARAREGAGEIREVLDNGPGSVVVNMTVPESYMWAEMTLPAEMVQEWDGTRYEFTLQGSNQCRTVEAVIDGASSDLEGLLQLLGAVEGMILQLRVDLRSRTGIAEVMAWDEYRALLGEG